MGFSGQKQGSNLNIMNIPYLFRIPYLYNFEAKFFVFFGKYRIMRVSNFATHKNLEYSAFRRALVLVIMFSNDKF
jgi:hypothetical protein